jgi:hypothetical protein
VCLPQVHQLRTLLLFQHILWHANGECQLLNGLVLVEHGLLFPVRCLVNRLADHLLCCCCCVTYGGATSAGCCTGMRHKLSGALREHEVDGRRVAPLQALLVCTQTESGLDGVSGMLLDKRTPRPAKHGKASSSSSSSRQQGNSQCTGHGGSYPVSVLYMTP